MHCIGPNNKCYFGCNNDIQLNISDGNVGRPIDKKIFLVNVNLYTFGENIDFPVLSEPIAFPLKQSTAKIYT